MARGSIVKRPSGNYAIIYYVDGEQKWKTIGPRKKDAEKALSDIITRINTGQYQELKEIRFSEFTEKWLKDYAEPRVKASTLRFYSDIVALHLKPRFGKYKLISITPHLIEEYLSDKHKESRLSSTSIGYHLRVLKTILKRAIIWGYLKNNPAQHIEKPRVEKKEMDFLNVEEIRLFLENVELEYYPHFLTAVFTGMRRGELLALKWSDVNWATNQIHVRRSLVLGKIDEPKSRAAIRAIIMPPLLVKVLKKHKLSCTPSEQDFIFPNREGKILDAGNLIKRHLLPALRRAGLRRITFHSLRHSYASLLIAQGENLKYIQSALGHSSAQVTLDRYGHLMPQVQHGAGERLENTIFNGAINKTLAEK